VDTLTHALSGALLARATASRDAAPRSIPRRVAAGFFACAAPDLDFVIGFAGPVEYLLHHRGITHSLLLLPLWAIPLAWILAKILREPGGWRALYGVSAMGIGLHIAGDWITSFGTMMLAPLSDWRAGIGTTFIIDLWFSGIILVGLIFSSLFFRTRIPAVVASLVLCGYVGFQYVLKQGALDVGEGYAQSLRLKDARITAHPRPVSPFNWTVFVSDATEHHYAHVSLIRKEMPEPYKPGDGFIARLSAPYLPAHRAIWVQRTRYGHTDAQTGREAWNSEGLGFFRWFADLPALEGRDERCVWFADLRFLTPGRDRVPFRFGACKEDSRSSPGSPWRAYESDPDRGARPLD
jgi:inner membrane protein